LVRFEDLVADPLAGFRAIATKLGLLGRVPQGTLENLVEQYSFEQLSSGRKRGEEDPGHHYRRGVPGDWKTHFGAEHRWLFAQRHDDLLSRYGYCW
jgi:hypothetical protein